MAQLPLLVCLIAVLALLVARGDVPGESAYPAFQSARLLANASYYDEPAQYGAGVSCAASLLFLAPLAGWHRMGGDIPQAGLLLSVAGWLVSIVAVYGLGLRFNRPVMAVFAAAALAVEPALFGLAGRDVLFVMGWLWGGLALVAGGVRATTSPPLVGGGKSSHPHAGGIRGGAYLGLAALVALAACTYDQLNLAWGGCSTMADYVPALAPGLALLAGWNLDWAASRLKRLPLPPAERRALILILVLLALLGLVYGRGAASLLDFTPHTAERVALWSQVGLWLRQNAPAGTTVWSDQKALVGYFSGWSTWRVVSKPDGVRGRVLDVTYLPEYCVTSSGLTWADWVERPWFQAHYRRVYTASNSYDSMAPLVVWRYRPDPFEAGCDWEADAVWGQLAGEQIEMEGYCLDSSRIIPGQAQHLMLVWSAPGAVTRTLGVRLRLYAEETQQMWAEVVNDRPAGARTSFWRSGDYLFDRYTLDMPPDIPPGAYRLEAQVYMDELEHVLPVMRDGSIFESLTLAYLEVQPWVSTQALQADYPITATFDDGIELVGYSLRPALLMRGDWGSLSRQAGTGLPLRGDDAAFSLERDAQEDVLRVRLYWHAQAAPAGFYHIFVHLLSPDGRLLAQHDGVPVYGTRPTSDWQAGQYILDEHLVPLGPDVPPGRYTLRIGLYRPDSGQRLAVRNHAGTELPDRSLFLAEVELE
ncbi:MAG: hypothetical protein JW850_14545 [Thermoflexales bacterium]|nr:hypothetical protein [Thermoflexales bacterium]